MPAIEDSVEPGKAFGPGFGGTIIDRHHPGYDRARGVWNGLIDRRPAVIARCSSVADVVEAVRFAGEHRPPVSIRAGGHQVAGSAVCDDGLVIDLSAMTGVDVDPARRTARVRAGTTVGSLDTETQVFGLAVPGGDVTGTGVAGLALGGGIGLLARAHGLTCDHLRSIEIVTADGLVRTAGPGEHTDLLWAARGCGRGLGVVTSLEFDLVDLGPSVSIVEVYYPAEQGESVLRAWRDAVSAVPDTVSPMAILRGMPPYPQVPAELHDTPIVGVGAVFAGPPERAEAALAPLRRLGTPLLDVSGTVGYEQSPSPPAGATRSFMKSHFLDELTDDAIRTLLDQQARSTAAGAELVIRTMGGAIRAVPPERSAFPHRGAGFNVNVNAIWRDAGLDDAILDWSRSAWAALGPHANGGVYLNFSGLDEDAEAVHDAVYGPSAARLNAIRAAFDPDGLFSWAARRP
ncbi:FAD-binding oxidoreductase [Amycolatopsis alba]|uniref:FAD-binding oxidoreductase n=1 Tax=Amycolatopsis alba DSM 44262 TaxID=1125972 RepID=A0A229RPU5_AMYAL|nr:FAD-binding oxidoreductase [Amycolatopsis alba]OXM48499.1 FAD-binding oxidoreductase [Amycolatopsis alba DSM 44262]